MMHCFVFLTTLQADGCLCGVFVSCFVPGLSGTGSSPDLLDWADHHPDNNHPAGVYHRLSQRAGFHLKSHAKTPSTLGKNR